MTRIWMIALAFFGAMFLAACEPADDAGQEPAMQDDTGGGMGSPTAPE